MNGKPCLRYFYLDFYILRSLTSAVGRGHRHVAAPLGFGTGRTLVVLVVL